MRDHAGQSASHSNTNHTSPNTAATRSPPCHTTHTRSSQMTPQDSYRGIPQYYQWNYTRSAPNHSYRCLYMLGSSRSSARSGCPTETAARSARHAPPSPTPLPSATDSRCSNFVGRRVPNHALLSRWRWIRLDADSSLKPCGTAASSCPAGKTDLRSGGGVVRTGCAGGSRPGKIPTPTCGALQTKHK